MGSALLLMGVVVAGAYGIRPIGHEEAPKELNHASPLASPLRGAACGKCLPTILCLEEVQ